MHQGFSVDRFQSRFLPRGLVAVPFEFRDSVFSRCHTERSHFSGGGKDLARPVSVRPNNVHARSPSASLREALTRLNSAGIGMTPSKERPKIKTAPLTSLGS